MAFSDFIQSVQADAMLTAISDRTQRRVSDNWQEKARMSGGKKLYRVYFVTQILQGFPTDRTRASTIRMRLITIWSVAGPFNEVREIVLGNTLNQLLRKFRCEITQINTVNNACQTRSVNICSMFVLTFTNTAFLDPSLPNSESCDTRNNVK